jgi:hypothetical protein
MRPSFNCVDLMQALITQNRVMGVVGAVEIGIRLCTSRTATWVKWERSLPNLALCAAASQPVEITPKDQWLSRRESDLTS